MGKTKRERKLYKSAKMGNANAMYRVGIACQLKGDLRSAAEWMTAAAEMDHEQAKEWMTDYSFDDNAQTQAWA